MSNPEKVGKNFRDNFCGGWWKSAGYRVKADKSCEETFDTIFSGAIKGLSTKKLNNAVSERDLFLDSFKLVGRQIEELCKFRAGWHYANPTDKQANAYLQCSRDVVAGSSLPRSAEGKTYRYLVYSDKDLPFAQMVQHLRNRVVGLARSANSTEDKEYETAAKKQCRELDAPDRTAYCLDLVDNCMTQEEQGADSFPLLSFGNFVGCLLTSPRIVERSYQEMMAMHVFEDMEWMRKREKFLPDLENWNDSHSVWSLRRGYF